MKSCGPPVVCMRLMEWGKTWGPNDVSRSGEEAPWPASHVWGPRRARPGSWAPLGVPGGVDRYANSDLATKSFFGN